jgi:hypothetical protein
MSYVFLQIGLLTGALVVGYHLSKKYMGMPGEEYVGVTYCSAVAATALLLCAKELEKY